MIDHLVLAQRSARLTALLRSTRGSTTWKRVADWNVAAGLPPQWTPPQPGDADYEGPEEPLDLSDRDAADRRDAALTAKYQKELGMISSRIDRDMARVERIIELCNPPKPAELRSKELLAAQVAADGWCVSCHRNDQTLTPIQVQPSGVPFYRDLCRFCGEWKAEHRALPPLPILVLRHAGRRVTTADVDKALGRTA